MKSSLSLALAAVVAILITFSCQRPSDDPGPHLPYAPSQVTTASADISGRVLDDANQPVSAAVVKVGTVTATTDVNGSFNILQATLNKNAGFIKVEKDGFFTGSRTIMINGGATHHVTIQLIPKKVAGTVSATGGGNVTVPSGGTIAFTGNSFTNTGSNSAYTGTVSVNAFFINPEAANFKEIMPGALRGINASNKETGLQSFGMMAVELNGAAGEKLQLATGKTATITFPIPASLLAQAPATIPLWSFNDSTGLWKEEGTATKQGNNYVGTVGHFSFWNCDYPYEVIDFQATFQNQDRNPMFQAMVVLKGTTDSISTYGYTDNTGWVGGKVPSNKPLKMYVYSKCKTLLFTKEIGPFTKATDLGTFTLNNTGVSQLTIIGSVVNCSKVPVTAGFVDVFLDGAHNRVSIKNAGVFSITFERCNPATATAILTAYDINNNLTGVSTNLSVSTGSVNAGELTACGTSIAEFANYSMNNVSYNFSNPIDSITLYKSGANYTMYVMHKSNSADNSSITFAATGTGTGTLSNVYVNANNKYWHLSNPTTLTITEFGAVGTGYVAGNFSNKMADSTTTTQITYSFRVKRAQ